MGQLPGGEGGRARSTCPDICRLLLCPCSARCKVCLFCHEICLLAACCLKLEETDGAQNVHGKVFPLIFLPNTDKRELASRETGNVNAKPSLTGTNSESTEGVRLSLTGSCVHHLLLTAAAHLHIKRPLGVGPLVQ